MLDVVVTFCSLATPRKLDESPRNIRAKERSRGSFGERCSLGRGADERKRSDRKNGIESFLLPKPVSRHSLLISRRPSLHLAADFWSLPPANAVVRNLDPAAMQ